MGQKELEAILAARRVIAPRPRRAPTSVAELGLQDASEFVGDDLAKIILALLVRSPQPLAELEARTGLPPSAIYHSLITCPSEYAGDFSLESLYPTRRATSPRELRESGATTTAFPFSFVGVAANSEKRLARYVAERLKESVLPPVDVESQSVEGP